MNFLLFFSFIGIIQRNKIKTLRTMQPKEKHIKNSKVEIKLKKVIGELLFLILFITNKLKIMGCIYRVTNKIHEMPMTLIKAIEFIAGCFAKNKDPIPIIVVIPDKIIANLYGFNEAYLYLYFLSNPSVIKMLKSSPNPKIRVAIIILTKLNWIFKIEAIPNIQIQLINIGKNVKRASSILP